MNQALEIAMQDFAKRLNAHFKPRTDLDQDIFLTDLFEQLGAKTPEELNQVATLIIQKHKPQGWPSVAHVLDYANKVSAKQNRVTVIEKDTPEWDRERKRRVKAGQSVALMDRSKTWTVAPARRVAR